MANWATTDYMIEGPKETLQKIHQAIIQHDVVGDSDKDWEGNILNALGISWQNRKPNGSGYYMRGFIQDEPSLGDNTLEFWAEEAWGATDFHKVLQKAFPDIKVYYSVEEPDGEVFATNDRDGKYFPYRYYADICKNGLYHSDYFTKKESAYNWISETLGTEIKSPEDIQKYNESCSEDDYLQLHYFSIVD